MKELRRRIFVIVLSMAMLFSTMPVSFAAEGSAGADGTAVAEVVGADGTSKGTFDNIKEAIAAADAESVVNVLQSVNLGNQSIVISKEVTIDLGENTLASSAGQTIEVSKTGKLTIKNGVVNNFAASGKSFYVYQGKLIAKEITVEKAFYGVDILSSPADGTLIDCEITAEHIALRAQTGGNRKSGATIKGGVYSGGTVGIQIPNDGNVFSITDTKIIGEKYGIEILAGTNIDAIENAEITGETAISAGTGSTISIGERTILYGDTAIATQGQVTYPDQYKGFIKTEEGDETGKLPKWELEEYTDKDFEAEITNSEGTKQYRSFGNAIEASEDEDTIKVLKTVSLESSLIIQSKCITIDLNGQTITSGAKDSIIVMRGADVTIQGDAAGKGKIITTNTGVDANAIYAEHSTVNLDHVIIESAANGIKYYGSPAQGVLTDCKITAKETAVNSQTGRNSGKAVSIQGGIYKGGKYGLEAAQEAVIAFISGAEVYGGTVGIYAGNLSNINGIKNTKIYAQIGIQSHQGARGVVIERGTEVHGTTPVDGDEKLFSYPAGVTGFALQDPEAEGNPVWILEEVKGDPVAQVGDKEFLSFAAAFDFAKENGGTIQMVADYEEQTSASLTVKSNENIKIALNGCSLIFDYSGTSSPLIVNQGGNLSIVDTTAGSVSAAVAGEPGAPENAGTLMATVATNGRKMIQNAGTLTIDGVNLIMASTVAAPSCGTAGTAVESTGADSFVSVINSSISCPSRALHGSNGTTVTNLKNSRFVATAEPDREGSNYLQNPVAVFLAGTEDTKIEIENDITSCYAESESYGFYLEYCHGPDISIVDCSAEVGKYQALSVNDSEIGDILNGEWHNTKATGKSSDSAIELSSSEVGSVTGTEALPMKISGGEGITIIGGSVEALSNIDLTAKNTDGITINGEWDSGIRGMIAGKITGVGTGDSAKIAMDNVKVTAVGIGMNIPYGSIEGDIRNCEIHSSDWRAVFIEDKGKIESMTETKITQNCTNTTGAALWIQSDSDNMSKFENVEIMTSGNLKVLFISSNQEASFTNCTFTHTGKYQVKNVGDPMILTGRINGHESSCPNEDKNQHDFALESDATIEIISGQPMEKPIYLHSCSNPNNSTLTVQGAAGTVYTLTRADSYKGAMFQVETGGLILKNITLRGNEGATAPLVTGSWDTTITLDDGAVLTGNQIDDESHSAAGLFTDGNIQVQGMVQAIGNMVGDVEKNIYLADGQYIKLLDGLKDGAKIGVTTRSVPAENSDGTVTPVQITTEEQNPDTGFFRTARAGFKSDNTDYDVISNETGKYLELGIQESGNVNTKVETEGAPEASSPDLEANKNSLLTDVGKQAIAEGKDVTLKLVLAGTTVAPETESQFEQAASGKALGDYFDISLFQTIEGEEASELDNLNAPVTITLTLPDELKEKGENFTILCERADGTIDEISVTDNQNGTITFTAEELTTYVIAYDQVTPPVDPEEPDRPSHTHHYGDQWKHDAESHWKECICGRKSQQAEHISDGGVIKKPATDTEDGLIVYTCTVCGRVLKEEIISKLGPTQEDLDYLAAFKLVARSKMSKLHSAPAVRVHWFDKYGKKLNLAGYEVYRSTKRYSGYGTKPWWETKKTYYYNNKQLKKGTRFYYKVRGYNTFNGKRYYTDWSLKAWRTVRY